MPSKIDAPDRPALGQGSIGQSIPRSATRRLLHGRGRFIDDIQGSGVSYAAFLRSPFAHADILSIDCSAARRRRGVLAVYTSEDLEAVVQGWQGISKRFPSLVSPAQHALARKRAVWQGEPVVIAVADSRAAAEDALEHVDIEWSERPVCADVAHAAEPDAALVHPDLGTNVALEQTTDSGDVEALFAEAAVVVEENFHFSRHTGAPLETRGIIASYDTGEESLSVWQSTQVPNQSKEYLAEVLGLPSHRVSVVAPDVGGAFGMKMHIYPDEVAVCAASLLLGRPVKYICDRLETFASDVHAREHVLGLRMAVNADGQILAFEADDLFAMGAYSSFPRTGVLEPIGAMRLIGAPYAFSGYRSRMRACFVNKPPGAQCRAVGHPIAVTATERLVDKAARKLGIDPLEFRKLNYRAPGTDRVASPAGATTFDMSHQACLETLTGMMDVTALRAEQQSLRQMGRWRGIGFAAYVEMTATGPGQYGSMGVRVSAMDTATLVLESSGAISCAVTVTEQGQGTTGAMAQIVADAVGVDADAVVVRSGDSAAGMGGGAWASRGIAIGGEAAWRAGRRLRANILEVAAALLQRAPADLEITAGAVVDAETGERRLELSELAHLAYFRAGELPSGLRPAFSVSEQYFREQDLGLPTNGIHAAHVEIDPGTGEVRMLDYWVVDDCGTVINPLLLDEQIRGGVVQGLGAALYEHLPYDDDGQLLAGTLADYRMPLASEMPDITIGHVVTPYSGTGLGAKGGGEAGTCAAAAAVLNAVNDALDPLGASVARLPLTSAVILGAIIAAEEGKGAR